MHRETARRLWRLKKKAKATTPQLRHRAGGMLNPAFVDWLMGFPIGFTDCAPLEMRKFLRWFARFGYYFQTDGKSNESSAADL